MGETKVLRYAQIISTKKWSDNPSLNVNLMMKILFEATQKASAESIWSQKVTSTCIIQKDRNWLQTIKILETSVQMIRSSSSNTLV